MVLRGIHLKHLHLCSPLPWVSRDIAQVNSQAQILQVIHPREVLSKAMECPQLHKLHMGVKHQLSLDMEQAMELVKHRSLWQILLSMDRPSILPVPEAMPSLLLFSQDIPLHSHHHLAILNPILVHSVPHHLVMELHQVSQVILPMVLHLQISKVMCRDSRLTTPHMVVVTPSLQYTLMVMQLVMLVGPTKQHQLHRLSSRVE